MDTRIAISSATTIIPATFILPLSVGAVGDEGLTTYDLVSHGGNTGGKNECRGSGANNVYYGPGFQNPCIHSGTIKTSGDVSTAWYNYALASAGTIIDENTTQSDPAANAMPATESICPKGWTLPNNTQISAIGNNTATYIPSFSPVKGGVYDNITLYNEDASGFWWSSTAYDGVNRYRLAYNGSYLYTLNYARFMGLYIRCVAKQKTITDLAYMQDVTPKLASGL